MMAASNVNRIATLLARDMARERIDALRRRKKQQRQDRACALEIGMALLRLGRRNGIGPDEILGKVLNAISKTENWVVPE